MRRCWFRFTPDPSACLFLVAPGTWSCFVGVQLIALSTYIHYGNHVQLDKQESVHTFLSTFWNKQTVPDEYEYGSKFIFGICALFVCRTGPVWAGASPVSRKWRWTRCAARRWCATSKTTSSSVWNASRRCGVTSAATRRPPSTSCTSRWAVPNGQIIFFFSFQSCWILLTTSQSYC